MINTPEGHVAITRADQCSNCKHNTENEFNELTCPLVAAFLSGVVALTKEADITGCSWQSKRLKSV